MKDFLGLADGPFVPVGIGVPPVPLPCKFSNLVQWNRFPEGKSMTEAPLPNLLCGTEGQHHRAVFMYVAPGLCRGNCKVYQDFL